MQLRPGLMLDDNALAELCRRHGVRRLEIFGSVLRDTFNANSDIDLLVEFIQGRSVGLLEIAEFELELSELLDQREVEIRSAGDLSPLFRDQVRREARELYAA
jgi:predicted nucleotidyltransferase